MSSSSPRRLSSLLIALPLMAGCWWFASSFLGGADAWIFSKIGGQSAYLEGSSMPRVEVPTTVEKRTLHPVSVGALELDDEQAGRVFAALPLGPQDFAVILARLQAAGVKTVGISSPLIWQTETGDMSREIFCSALRKIPQAAVGLRGRTAASADFTPVELQNTAIPAENISGDVSGFPSANRALPNGFTDKPDALDIVWAPDWLEDEPLTGRPTTQGSTSFPLFVRWNGEVIPTLPLRLAMMARGIRPEDVKVSPGRELHLGTRRLPLDANGRTRLVEARVQTLDPTVVFGSSPAPLPEAVLVEQPATAAGNPERLGLLARTCSTLLAEESVSYQRGSRLAQDVVYTPAPVQADMVMALKWGGGIGLAALLLLPFFPALLRRGVLLAVPVWVLYRAWICPPQWFSVCGAMLCWAVLCWGVARSSARRRGVFSSRRR